MFLSYTDFVRVKEPTQLLGKVIDAETGMPLEKVHIYIQLGNEEALSNSKGEFRLLTWEKLPITVTAALNNYTMRITTVKEAAHDLKIKLRKK